MVQSTVHRLKIHLLVSLAVLLVSVDHSHLHVGQVQTRTVHLIVLIIYCLRRLRRTLMRSPLRRLTHFMALPFLLLLVLPNQALVPGCVVVVREELSQQQVHVWSTLSVWSRSRPVPSLSAACRISQLSEVLNVYVVCLRVMLHAPTLLANQIVNSLLAMRVVPIVLGLGFETIVSHAEHLARKGVGHDSLARLAGHLS